MIFKTDTIFNTKQKRWGVLMMSVFTVKNFNCKKIYRLELGIQALPVWDK